MNYKKTAPDNTSFHSAPVKLKLISETKLMTKLNCDACGSANIYTVYDLPRIPAFQNRLFPARAQALEADAAEVELVACPDCGLVFNSKFDSAIMDYNSDYQNAQDHSPHFRSYLDEIADLILARLKQDDKIVEVGCGKGYFLDVLRSRGVSAVGFDPAYEGDADYVTREYFNSKTANVQHVDAIVMRHTLEHIEAPYNFLLEMKKFLPEDTLIFIEVPRFEWIVEHRAFWDVFHEHCNYFTEDFFNTIFSDKAHIQSTFYGHYMLVSGRIGDLVEKIAPRQHPVYSNTVGNLIPHYRRILLKAKRNLVWGAGAKGVSFVNLVDPEATHIEAVIDINVRKQGNFIPLTGHPCVAPASIDWQSLTDKDHLWIMNGNYSYEILHSLPLLECQVSILGE